MTAWDFFNNVINAFPPVAFALLLAAALAAVVVFITGFAKHGVNFLKYGFKQMVLNASLEKRFDDLDAQIGGLHSEMGGLHNDIGGLRSEIGGLHNDIGDLRSEIGGLHNDIGGLHSEIDGLRCEFKTELQTIKVNHFGHLKKYLTVLNGILLDKNVIDNESKARLDNELDGM
jgi:hypothetical protein